MKRSIQWIAVLLLMEIFLCSCSAPLVLDDGDGPLYQYELPQKGDSIAIFHTNYGDITVRFFENEAPKAVENFITHAKNGYYNDQIFYRVIYDFVIQSGSPNNNTTGGESIWGKPFADEFSPKLHNLRGALCMANSGANTNGSQFFIVQRKNCFQTSNDLQEMQKQKPEYGYTQKIIDAYQSNGGCPSLDQKHTVFGQVIDGMDIIDTIVRVKVDKNDCPVQDVIIETVKITTYAG